MAEALAAVAKLLVVREIHEDEGGAILRFHQGADGRIFRSAAKYASYLRLAQRSQERQHPVGVSFGEGPAVTKLIRAENDVPMEILEEDRDRTRVLFQGHDGVFVLRLDHPESARILAVLTGSRSGIGRVWFLAQEPDLALLDVLLVEKV
jgi:hypothetical protein